MRSAKKLFGFIFFFIIFLTSLQSQIIPDDLTCDWKPGVTVGVPGGIPVRTVVYKTLSPGATAVQINTALAACPDNQVVMLDAGTYNLSAAISIPTTIKKVTLRGAGMGKTILNMNTGTAPSIKSEETSTTYGVSGTITSGYSKGSTSITVSTTTNTSNGIALEVGTMLMLYEANDPDLVWSRSGAKDLIRQPVVITGISGKTVTFTPALVISLKSSLNPRFGSYYPTPASFVGFEDFTLNQVSKDQWATIWFSGNANWFKNLEIINCGDIAICLTQTVCNEVRGCYIHGTSATNEGYGVDAYTENTGLWIEDNIFSTLWSATILDNAMGSVVSYNYSHNMYIPPLGYWPHQTPGYIIQHMPHGMMTLWEGNIGQQIQSDGYHGSGSHQTIFRNSFNGLNSNYTTNRKMIDLCRYSYYHNIVGNVLGDASWKPDEYEMTGTNNDYSHSVIYRLGYPNCGNNSYSLTNPPSNAEDGGYDPKCKSTLLRHGNYDYFNKSVVWDPAISDHFIPASLIYSTKPSFFGSCQWPCIGPDLSPMINTLPAKSRFEGSTMCNATDKPIVTSALTANGSVGVSFQFKIYASGNPTSYAAKTLPAGLFVNTSTGLISGIPTTAGTTNVTISAINSYGSDTAKLLIIIAQAAKYTLTVNGGTGSGSYTAGSIVSIKANPPAAGKEFDKWTGVSTGISDIHSSSASFTMPAAGATITATYKTVLGMNEIGTGVSVYPNPVHDIMTISGIEPFTIVTIYNMNGERVFGDQITNTNPQIRTEQFVPGIYVIRIFNKGIYESYRFIKE